MARRFRPPTAILRFAVPGTSFWQRFTRHGFGRFYAGDLVGIVPTGATRRRFYSLASANRDGFVEPAVSKHPGGLRSCHLMVLQPRQMVQAFLRPNPVFHPDNGKTPLILIGAGTGIGPLAGFIRAQGQRRPMLLWFNTRDPDADLLFGQDLVTRSDERRLTGRRTALSSSGRRQYVQDSLRQHADALRALIAIGARIMACGGRDMALGAREALTDIPGPVGHSVTSLTAEGRNAEDSH